MLDRAALDTLIMKNDTKDWWQPDLFVQNTKHLLPPELEILIDPPSEDQNYNCFLYAFGLHTDAAVLQETKGFIYDSFVKHLLSIGELITTDMPIEGDYVVYQDLVNYPESLTHIGVLQGDKVVSKWAWGPLVKHALWDVPAEYGDEVFYIQAVQPSRAAELYQQYKEHNQLKQ